MRFDHEALDAYQFALGVARWFRETRFPYGDADLKDQGKRASQSAALNIAEGRARSGKSRTHHYTVAHGSAAEACAVLDIVDLPDKAQQQHKLRRVGQMLRAMGA
jgi:four helix bundle protein